MTDDFLINTVLIQEKKRQNRDKKSLKFHPILGLSAF